MRGGLIIIAAAMLGGACASSIPPELRDPVGHVRPIEGESVEVFVPDLMREAAHMSRDGDRVSACEMYRVGAQTGVEGAQAAFAECALEQGDLERAWVLMEEADHPSAILVGILSGKLPGDEVTLNAAIEAVPDDARLWNLLGREYERQGRDAEAVDAYLRAKRLG